MAAGREVELNSPIHTTASRPYKRNFNFYSASSAGTPSPVRMEISSGSWQTIRSQRISPKVAMFQGAAFAKFKTGGSISRPREVFRNGPYEIYSGVCTGEGREVDRSTQWPGIAVRSSRSVCATGSRKNQRASQWDSSTSRLDSRTLEQVTLEYPVQELVGLVIPIRLAEHACVTRSSISPRAITPMSCARRIVSGPPLSNPLLCAKVPSLGITTFGPKMPS